MQTLLKSEIGISLQFEIENVHRNHTLEVAGNPLMDATVPSLNLDSMSISRVLLSPACTSPISC
jgi:hypothetical protein